MNVLDDLLDLASLQKNPENLGFAFAAAGSSSSSSSSSGTYPPPGTVVEV
jgi:hypothetical protein